MATVAVRLGLPLAEGRALMASLQGKLSGLAQPNYMLDIPGGFGKVPLTVSPAEKQGDGYAVTDYKGGKHHYEDDNTNSHKF